MPEILKKLKLWLNHERYQVVSVVLVIVFVIWIQGCPSTCTSLLDETRKVTRNELQAELDLLHTRAADRVETLDQQDLLKGAIAENALLFTTTGTFNPVGLMTVVFSILGVGATVDNIRRRKDARAKS